MDLLIRRSREGTSAASRSRRSRRRRRGISRSARPRRPRPGNSRARQRVRRSRFHHSPNTRSGPSARFTRRRMPRQVNDTGGWSGSSANVSIGSGCGSSRAGRGQPAGHSGRCRSGRAQSAAPTAPARRSPPARTGRARPRRHGWRACRPGPTTSASGSSSSDEIVCFGSRTARPASRPAAWSRCRSRVDGLDLVAEQPRQPLHIPRSAGRVPTRMACTPSVDAAEQQIQPARAEALGLEHCAEHDRPAFPV